jgi:type I restriction enzyme S subunit
MTTLPRGWAPSTLGEIGDYLNGRGFKKSEWREAGRPIIRIQNLTGTSTHLNYFDGEAEERYTARSGDLLVSWAATLGVFVWKGPEAVVNQHIFKVRSYIDEAFHHYLLVFVLDDLRRQTHGSGMVHITKARFEQTPVAIPPIVEQRRIVTAIEEQFSRLDVAVQSLSTALRRISFLRKSILVSVVPRPLPSHWNLLRVGDVGRVQLGRQRSPKYHNGPNMKPYLRVANVFEDRLDLSDVMQMDFSPDQLERYILQPGDILLNEGQSPHLVGRPAMFRGELPEVCFTNSLIRFQPGPDTDGEFALLVFRSHLHSGRFQKEARITTNIAHMAAGRFKTVEFPVPPEEEQLSLVAETQRRLSLVDALEGDVVTAALRGKALRRSILECAFAGQLAAQDTSDEPASVLLERIAAERVVAPKPSRRSRKIHA